MTLPPQAGALEMLLVENRLGAPPGEKPSASSLTVMVVSERALAELSQEGMKHAVVCDAER